MGFIAWFATKEIMKYRKDRKRYNAKEIQKRFDDYMGYMGEGSVYDKWLNDVLPRIKKTRQIYNEWQSVVPYGALKLKTKEELEWLRNEYTSILNDMNGIEKIQIPRLTTFETEKFYIERELMIIDAVIKCYK